MNWMHEHSDPFGFADVNTPADVIYAEWVLSESYGLSKFIKEAKELKIPLETLLKRRFKEWKDDCKGKNDIPLSREE
jgi:hypothetical protein